MLQGHSGKMSAYACNTREISRAQRNGNDYFFCKTMEALLKFPSLVFILKVSIEPPLSHISHILLELLKAPPKR